VSEWTAAQISEALKIADDMGFDRIVSNQPQYSMLWRVIEAEVVPLCEKEGIGQIVWSPMAQGVLSGKYEPGAPPPPGSRATDQMGGANDIKWLLDDNFLRHVQNLKPIAADAGLSMPQLAVAWVLQNPNVSAAIVGASRPEQLADTAAASGVRLDDEIRKRIDEALEGVILADASLTFSPDPRPLGPE
jgi:aryl-alcohol dehydrogenase-like predicted oxidoreductase